MTPPFRIVKLIIAHFEMKYRHERTKTYGKTSFNQIYF